MRRREETQRKQGREEANSSISMASPWEVEESTAMESSPADIWAAEEARGGAISGLGTPPFFFSCRREEDVGDVPLQIPGGRRPHPERRRHSEEDAHGQDVLGAISTERFFSSTAGVAHEGVAPQRPLHLQHLQGRGEMPRYGHVVGTGGGGHHVVVHRRPNSLQQQRGRPGLATDGHGYGAGDKYSGGQSYGLGVVGCGEMAGGKVVTSSPKSSVSSAESRGGGGGPATVWELDSRAEDDGGLPEQRKRKRSTGIAAEIDIGLQQLHMIRLRESSPGLGDNVQGIDELKKFLLCDSMELESLGISTKGEIRKKEETITQLLQLVKKASLERDEARELLQELLNKIPQRSPVEHPSYVHPEDPSAELTRCDSGVTEFDSQSLSHGHQLYSYSPVQPLSDLVSSTELPNVRSIPDSSNTAMSQQLLLLPGYTSSMTTELPLGTAKVDRASAMIDALVTKKPLPEKGKLLQAVMEAGPLLQTLLLAGPLPQWRNPPPLQPFHMPAVSANACEAGTFNHNAVLSPNYLVQSSAKVLHYQNSLAASRIYAASSMKPSTLSPLCMRVPMLSTCASSYKVPIVKRQKI